jgi:hypothetical protein
VKGGKIMPQQQTHTEEAHPEDVETAHDRDLRAAPLSGGNWGLEGPHPEKDAPTAADIKEFHREFPEFTTDELRRIPVLPAGSRLEQGATYIDLRAADRQEFTATSDLVAADDNWYVPKSEVDYQLWNRLRGVQNAERIGEASEP